MDIHLLKNTKNADLNNVFKERICLRLYVFLSFSSNFLSQFL